MTTPGPPFWNRNGGEVSHKKNVNGHLMVSSRTLGNDFVLNKVYFYN